MKKISILLAGLLCFGLTLIYAQGGKVSGTVTSFTDGLPIPGVAVVVTGTTIGTTTNIDGQYSIDVPANATTLTFSFVGMISEAISIAGKSVIDVALSPDIVGLEEIVVVAYGSAKKESLTGSTAVIGQKKIESRSVSSVAQILTGSTTGIQTTAGSGQPGSSPDIRIRGLGTLNTSADPLIILDGAQYEGSLSSISPTDIASISILKDAASTALYGSRAANGVIIISTKRGEKGSENIKVNFKVQGGIIDRAIPNYEAVDAYDYYELQAEAFAQSRFWAGTDSDIATARAHAYQNISTQLMYNPFVGTPNNQIIGTDGKINPNAKIGFPDLDWYKAGEQQGYRQNYDLNLSGGSEKSSYFYSMGYIDEQGYVIKSDYERFNTRLNIDFDVKDWFQMGGSIDGSVINSDNGATTDATYANLFRNARLTAPIYPIYLVDQATGEYILDGAGEKQYDDGGLYSRPINIGRNAIAEMNWNSDEYKRNNLGGRSYMKFSIFNGLTATINAGVNYQNYHSKGLDNAKIGDGAPGGRFDERRYTRTTLTFNQLLEYEKSLNDIHNFSVLLGHESYARNYTYQRGFKNQFIVTGINELNNYVNTATNTSYSTDKTVEGFFTRLKYNYSHKYYIEGSYRRDGSSVFHRDVRWGNFYSVGGSWRISEEEFIKNNTWIDILKLRASYGEVGNDNIDSGDNNYGYRALYETYPNGSNPGVRWSTVGNEGLTWEVNKTSDIALDFAFFNRLDGSIEWYNRTSDKLLYDMPLPLSMGLLEQPQNIASMTNKGLEINIGVDIIQTNEFRWNMRLMGSTNVNEVTSIPDPFVNGTKKWSQGHSVYDFWLRKFYDINPENGATRYHVWEEITDESGEVITDKNGNSIGTQLAYDENGDPVLTEDQNAAGFGYVGASAFPDLLGSIGNEFTYKGITLSTLFTYSLGGKMLDGIYQGMIAPAPGESLHPDVKNSWKNPGDIAEFPRLQYSNSALNATSDKFLTSSDYLNIRNVTLSYDIPKAIINSWGIGQLSVFVTGENLKLFTARKGMNPLLNFQGTTDVVAYSPSRSIIVGFNLQF